MTQHRYRRIHPAGSSAKSVAPIAFILVLALTLAACTPADQTGSADTTSRDSAESVFVEPNYDADEILVNIFLSDDGIEPSTIFIPAGKPVRLVLRNRGTREHHFRVGGIVPINMAWYTPADVDAYDIDTMSPEQLAELGIENSSSDAEHELHHQNGAFLPFKKESLSGVKPLPNEVHGYVQVGLNDVMSFLTVNTGVFVAEDVLHPEFQARVIVFDPGVS